MGNAGDVEIDTIGEEQGFLWLCGLCESKPTFITIYDLFAHKREHRKHSNEEVKRTCPKKRKRKKEPVFEESANPEPLVLVDVDGNFSDRANTSASDEEENTPLSYLRLGSTEGQFGTESDEKTGVLIVDEQLHGDDLPDEKNFFVDSLVEIDWDPPKEFSDETSEPSDTAHSVEVVKKKRTKHICKICNAEFASRKLLSKHKPTHTIPKTGLFQCDTCGKLCPKYDNFTRHLAIHAENRTKSFSCDRCLSRFYNMADLKRHAVTHLEVKPFNCEHCGEGFTRQDALLIHMVKHTGVKYEKFTCKLCNKVLNSPSALAMHSKNHTEKSIFCEEPNCNFSCYLQSQLRQHLRRHSGEKPFQCFVCGRCFSRSNDMKNHVLNVHERVRPHKCPDCKKEFTLLSSLKTHRLIHLEVRPYLCAECGKRFNHPSTLRKHTLYQHRHVCQPHDDDKMESKLALMKVQMQNEVDRPHHPQHQVTLEDQLAKSKEGSYPTVEAQPHIPIVTIHIPQITVQLDPSFPQTYIIPTITIPVPPQL